MKKSPAILLPLIVLISGPCQAAIILSGDFGTGTGQVSITQDLSFEITTAGAPRRIILDEFLVFDGSMQGPFSNINITYAINDVDQINPINFQLFDGGIALNDLTENDLHISFFGSLPPSLGIGDVFTIRSIDVTGFSAATDFNMEVGSASNIFLINQAGTRISDIQTSIPEPTSLIPLSLLGGLGLLCRRRGA